MMKEESITVFQQGHPVKTHLEQFWCSVLQGSHLKRSCDMNFAGALHSCDVNFAPVIRKSHQRSSGRSCVFKTQQRFQNAATISKRNCDLHFGDAISISQVQFQNADSTKLVCFENGRLWFQYPNWKQFEGVHLSKHHKSNGLFLYKLS